MTYNYYIDKKLNNVNDSFVKIKPEYPLICGDDEAFKIKLIDFSYLNNEYNVSSKLQNNTIKLEKTAIKQVVNFTNIPNVIDYTSDLNSIVNQAQSIPSYLEYYENFQKIIGDSYNIYYYDNEIIDGVNNFGNIFNVENLKMYDDEKYIVIESITDFKILRKINYGVFYDGTELQVSVTFDLNIEGSFNGIDYTKIDYLIPAGNSITFNSGSNIYNELKTLNNLNLSNDVNYKYYRFKLYSSLPSNENNIINKFRLGLLNVFHAPYELVDTVLEPVIYEKIIPDGFYNSVNYINKINELLTDDNIVLSLDNFTNKITFKNNNITPEYVESDTDYNYIVKLILDNNNIKKNIGLINNSYIINRDNSLICDTNINLVNFAKLVISCNLTFENKTHNDLIEGNDESTGVGNVLCWLQNDGVPFTYINYTNYNNLSYVVNDSVINEIILYFYNENKQKISIDNTLIHLQVQKIKK